jgi:tRNA-binding EMAP/Myf-like protein
MSATSARIHALLQRLSRLEELAQNISPAELQAKISAAREHKLASTWNRLLERAETLNVRVAKLEAQGDEYDPAQLEAVLSRIELLERGVVRLQTFPSTKVHRVAQSLAQAGVEHFDFVRVPLGDAAKYYDMALEDRAKLVGASSPGHMLKTLLVSVAAAADEDQGGDEEEDAVDPKHLALVMVQYNAELDTGKLKRVLKQVGGGKPSLAPAAVAMRVLGFENNGVAPVGGLTPGIPLVVAKAIMNECAAGTRAVCGGGEANVKLRMDMHEFVAKLKQRVVVADVTRPRAVAPPQVKVAPPSSAVVVAGTKRGQEEEDAATTTKKKPTPPPADDGDNDDADFNSLDVRVGLVVKAWKHPKSDKLLCEEIDVGESNPRSIASGIQAYYAPEQFQGKLVTVMCVVAGRGAIDSSA